MVRVVSRCRVREQQRSLYPVRGEVRFGYYVPLDEILEAPMTKILRALKRFDWADREDLWLALGYDVNHVEQGIRNCFAQTLLRLIREGLVECRYRGGPVRITPTGLCKLDDLTHYDISEPANENGTNYSASGVPREERWRAQRARYRARRIADGDCVQGRNHGPATRGQLCDKCYEDRVVRRGSKQATNQ